MRRVLLSIGTALLALGLALAGSTLLSALTFFWATAIAAIAVVGTYIIRVYKDVRGRPPYIIESVIGEEPPRD